MRGCRCFERFGARKMGNRNEKRGVGREWGFVWDVTRPHVIRASDQSINQSWLSTREPKRREKLEDYLSLGRHHMISEGRSRIHGQAADSFCSARLEGSQVFVFSLLCFTKEDVINRKFQEADRRADYNRTRAQCGLTDCSASHIRGTKLESMLY
jgi:hypothetical protein